MNISSKVILKKIESEIQQAKQETVNREAYLRRIANVKVLCELLLDEPTDETTSTSVTKPTVEEVERMMKGTQPSKQAGESEHNPESIFDF